MMHFHVKNDLFSLDIYLYATCYTETKETETQRKSLSSSEQYYTFSKLYYTIIIRVFWLNEKMSSNWLGKNLISKMLHKAI